MHVQSIKARVARADYVVDPAAVAEALLRRVDFCTRPDRPAGQTACS